MDKKLISNYLYNILYQIVKIAMPIIIVPYTMGHLGETALGISDIAANIASWFILFGTLGANVYGNRQIAKVRDDLEERSRTFFEILSMQLINMFIALILYILYIVVFVNNNEIIYILHCMTIISSSFEITWFYYGVENFKTVSIRNIIIKFIGVALIMLFVKSPEQLWLYVVINAGSDLFGQFIMYSQLKHYIRFVKYDISRGYLKHIKGTFALFVPTIAISVYTLLDQTMLGALTIDPGNVALYKAAQGFVRMFLYFITSIGAVMLPRITNVFYNKGGKEEATKYINTTLKIAFMLGIPMMVGMITVAPYFIPWYLPNQLEIASLIQYSSPIVLFVSISNVFGMQYLVPTGKNKPYTLSVVSGAVVNCIANYILIPKLAGIGAAIGSVIAEFVVMIVQYYFVKDDIKLQVNKNVIKYIVASIIMGCFVVVLGQKLGSSIITNIMQASLGVAVYSFILLILKEEMSIKVINKFLKRG